MQIVHVCRTLFELRMREKKKEGKKNKIEIFTHDFLGYEKVHGTLGFHL